MKAMELGKRRIVPVQENYSKATIRLYFSVHQSFAKKAFT